MVGIRKTANQDPNHVPPRQNQARKPEKVRQTRRIRARGPAGQRIVCHIGVAESDAELERLPELGEVVKVKIRRERRPSLIAQETLVDLAIEARQEKASRLGSPCSRRMNRRRNHSLRTAKSAMSTQVCPPHKLESSATVSISLKSWRVALLVRGSLPPVLHVGTNSYSIGEFGMPVPCMAPRR